MLQLFWPEWLSFSQKIPYAEIFVRNCSIKNELFKKISKRLRKYQPQSSIFSEEQDSVPSMFESILPTFLENFILLNTKGRQFLDIQNHCKNVLKLELKGSEDEINKSIVTRVSFSFRECLT